MKQCYIEASTPTSTGTHPAQDLTERKQYRRQTVLTEAMFLLRGSMQMRLERHPPVT